MLSEVEIKAIEEDVNDKWNVPLWTRDNIKKLLLALRESQERSQKMQTMINGHEGFLKELIADEDIYPQVRMIAKSFLEIKWQQVKPSEEKPE